MYEACFMPDIDPNEKIYFPKTFAFLQLSAYLCRPLINAALVKGLRRLPFTEESRVRIPYVVLKSLHFEGFFRLYDPTARPKTQEL